MTIKRFFNCRYFHDAFFSLVCLVSDLTVLVRGAEIPKFSQVVGSRSKRGANGWRVRQPPVPRSEPPGSAKGVICMDTRWHRSGAARYRLSVWRNPLRPGGRGTLASTSRKAARTSAGGNRGHPHTAIPARTEIGPKRATMHGLPDPIPPPSE